MNMSAFATKQDVEEIVGRVVGEILSDALQLIAGQFEQVNGRLARGDSRFDQIDERFNQLDKRFDQTESQFERIDKRFDHIDQEIGGLKQDVRDLHVITTRIDNRLEENIEATKLHSAQIRQLQRKIA
jgi:chromosome segregation ATPase